MREKDDFQYQCVVEVERSKDSNLHLRFMVLDSIDFWFFINLSFSDDRRVLKTWNCKDDLQTMRAEESSWRNQVEVILSHVPVQFAIVIMLSSNCSFAFHIYLFMPSLCFLLFRWKSYLYHLSLIMTLEKLSN